MKASCSTTPMRLVKRASNVQCTCLKAARSLPSRSFTSTAGSLAVPVTDAKGKGKAKQPSNPFRDTLLLPKTDFPLRADAANREKLFRGRTTEDLYRWQWRQKDRPLFVLHDGPPYANGHLHIGHALNKILKDVINRYKVLRGHRVYYKPGWDCHGLPIEHKALQQLKADHRELSPQHVRKIARKTAEEAIDVQMSEFAQFGLMCDWKHIYRTLDHKYEIRQLRAFQEMVRRGQIFRAVKPVLWSPSSKSALAEAEITYNDNHTSDSVFVRFELQPGSPGYRKLLAVAGDALQPDGRRNDSLIDLIIWTTTPWTLPANQFVAYGRDIEYVLGRVRGQGRLVVIAKDRVDYLKEVVGADIEVLATLKGSEAFEEAVYLPPFQSRRKATGASLPLIEASYVTPDSGTGLVHSAPAHGMDDYQAFLALSHGADTATRQMPSLVDGDGRFQRSSTVTLDDNVIERLEGKPVLGDGTKEVISLLHEQGLLVATRKIRHKYPYDWKTKQPVIIRATPQWFANLDHIKGKAIEALQEVKFIPEQGRNRLEAFVRSRSEWCISRQRAWGVPIPMVYRVSASGEETPIESDEVLQSIVSVLADKGIEHWWTAPVEDFLPAGFDVSGGETLRKGSDTMDVWLDSGVSWTDLLDDLKAEGQDDRQPLAEVYLEGSDQHRGWFQSSLLTRVALSGQAPFGNVITHGFVLDEEGIKMSKSVGNVISPLTVINGGKDKAKEPALGADALRFWAASATYTNEVNISTGILQSAAEGLRKIRNTIRFILGNLGNEPPSMASTNAADMVNLSLLDRYMLHELSILSGTAEEAYESFEFNRAMTAVSNFCSTTLSSFYFEIVKDSLYNDSLTSPARRGIVYVLQQTLPILLSIVAPVVPHLAEDVWQHRPDKAAAEMTSYFEQPWQTAKETWFDADLAERINTLKTLRDAVLVLVESARNEKLLRLASEAKVEVRLEGPNAGEVETQLRELDLNAFLGVSDVRLASQAVSSAGSLDWAWRKEGVTPLRVGDCSITITLGPSDHAKCPRCWLHTSPAPERLCKRCDAVTSANS